MSERELRDIKAGFVGDLDIVQLQKMISAAAEMKTEIKRFVDRWANAYSATIPESPRVPWRRVRPLVDAMEGWVNASLTEEEKRNEREM